MMKAMSGGGVDDDKANSVLQAIEDLSKNLRDEMEQNFLKINALDNYVNINDSHWAGL